MFTTTTLSAKSDSFNDPPSSVVSLVSRSSCGKLTTAIGGWGLFAVIVTRLAGALLVTSPRDFQLDTPHIMSRPAATSVITTRPGVQKDCFLAGSEEGVSGTAI